MDTDIRWDPFDTEIDTDPHPVWRRLRDEAPVYRNDEYDFWALSRYADVEAAHRDPRRYSSAHGTVLEIMGPNRFEGGQIIFMDPPDHTILRQLVSRAFTPRRVGGLEAQIRALCADMLDPLVGSGGFDYLGDFGAQLPSKVISALVGVPEADREHARELVDRTFHIEPGVGMINDTSLLARIALHEYLSGLVVERRRAPQDDMLTVLVEAEITQDGATRRLSDQEVADFAVLLFSAGTETVARLLGWFAVLLPDHPDQRDALAAEPALLPDAVEELLRYEAPSPVQGRWLTEEVELHGVTIPAGSKVLLLTGSAGRDERAYPDPDRLDVRRRIDNHVSFGHGIHFCVGASLARLESRIAMEETLTRFPAWEADHDRAVRLHTSTVRGYAEVPITL